MDQAQIDIRYTELLQWLEERYLIPKDWPSRLEILKTKKGEIIDNLFKKDTAEMKKLQNMFKAFKQIQLESLPYNDFSKLYQQLIKTEEAKDKSLFGRYNSPLIYSAFLLDGVYQKNNMHLAENAKIIVQNVSYDIPTCKKAINELKNMINEHEHKTVEKNEQIENNKEKLKNLLKSNDIDFDIESTTSNQIAMSLIERLSKDDCFEKLIASIEDKIYRNNKVDQAMSCYEDFYNMLYSKEEKVEKKSLTPKLYRFFTEGDYMVTPDKSKSDKSSKEARKAIIDYKTKLYQMKYTDQADVKSYNFSLVDENGNAQKKETKEESSSVIPNETCLLNTNEKNLLIADINELIIFISQRISKMNDKDEINLAMYDQSLKDFNLKYSNEDLSGLKTELESIISLFEKKELIFISDLFDDENNIKTIVDLFNEIKINNSKLKNVIAEYKKKDVEILAEIKENEKKINEFKKSAISIRKVTEMFLTKKLQRKINIMGDENLIAK